MHITYLLTYLFHAAESLKN